MRVQLLGLHVFTYSAFARSLEGGVKVDALPVPKYLRQVIATQIHFVTCFTQFAFIMLCLEHLVYLVCINIHKLKPICTPKCFLTIRRRVWHINFEIKPLVDISYLFVKRLVSQSTGATIRHPLGCDS